MYEVCTFSALVTRRQAIVMQVRLQAGREIKNNCSVRVLAWFSCSQLAAGYLAQILLKGFSSQGRLPEIYYTMRILHMCWFCQTFFNKAN